MSLIWIYLGSGIDGAWAFQLGRVQALIACLFQEILFLRIKWAFYHTFIIAVEFWWFLHHSFINFVCSSIHFYFSSDVSQTYLFSSFFSSCLTLVGDTFSSYLMNISCQSDPVFKVDILFLNFSNESSFLSSSISSIDDSWWISLPFILALTLFSSQ